MKSNFFCRPQNHILYIISLGFDKLYRYDTLCPLTLELDEEKMMTFEDPLCHPTLYSQ